MSTTIESFLADVPEPVREIDWVKPSGSPVALTTHHVLIGPGTDGLEVAVASSNGAPKADDVRALWKARWGRRAAPVLLVVAYTDTDGTTRASTCGTKDDPAVLTGLDLSNLERICAAALACNGPIDADRTLHRLLVGQKDALIAGLTNQGLFASHELRHGVPQRADWETARSLGVALLKKSGTDLIRGLGYTPNAVGSMAQILSVNGANHAVAILLNEDELFDRPSDRFAANSPVAQGLKIAKDQSLPWLVVTKGTQVRLYPAKPDVGVGRKGQSETYVELDLALLTEADAAYLPLLFGANALSEGGSVAEILAASSDHATALGHRLRERVYVDVVPTLAVAIANRMGATTEDDLHEAYHRTLIVLFRLLFVAYAEDRGLLPYQRNPRYTKKALKTLAREFTDNPDRSFDTNATDLWDDLKAVWRAVDDGHDEWGVPAYNGGLFAADDTHPSGQAIATMALSNSEVGPALKALLIDVSPDGHTGPVDFRAISVRSYGDIYEGLLESALSIAPSDLTLDNTGAYVPAKAGDDVVAAQNTIYFHNASGARKSTGSYYTKPFAVTYLLDKALEPGLTVHLDRVKAHLESGEETTAADVFFDFRIADLSMGSGHFLVAAIDRIEDRFSAFLAANPIPEVAKELTRLATAASAALGSNSSDIEIEPSALLRRQIARRCVYGLDLNLMAVELARLSIWIHTFVPGLPMSGLEHNLVVGNSLTGIGTLPEALDIFEPDAEAGQYSLFGEQIETALSRARDALIRVARTTEATKAEVREAARERAKAMTAAQDARTLLDAAVGVRLGMAGIPSGPDEALAIGGRQDVKDRVAILRAAHLPYLFPEVFLRDNPGFDVILGNPPWEKVKVERTRWWALRFPGLRALKQGEQDTLVQRYEVERPDLAAEYAAEVAASEAMRTVLACGPFPGLGKGDTDLYKGFAWRMRTLIRLNGRIGCVFPRSLLSESGTAKWREAMFDAGEFHEVTMLVNTGYWAFDDMEQRYTIALASMSRQAHPASEVVLRGPFHSLAEFNAGLLAEPSQFAAQEFRTWGTDAAFPMLPSPRSGEVFVKLHNHPRLDSDIGGWRARPYAELHSTADKRYFDLAQTGAGTGWPVYKGESFDLWTPDTGTYYGRCDVDQIVGVLQTKRVKGQRNSRSPFSEFKPEAVANANTLPCMKPRIVLRKITRATDSRTVRAALAPPHTTLADGAPFLLFPRGTAQDEAYLLGILSSIPLDWNARRVIEVNLTYHPLNGFPVPRPEADSPLRGRVIEISGCLAAVDARYSEWAAEVGVPVGSVRDEATKDDLIAELDAVVSLLYGLDRVDVEHIFETFHRGWDYQPRLNAVLAHYDQWKAKVAE